MFDLLVVKWFRRVLMGFSLTLLFLLPYLFLNCYADAAEQSTDEEIISWTSDVKKRKKFKTNSFYFNINFAVEGMAFNSPDSYHFTNAFMAPNAFVGINGSIGWQDYAFFNVNHFYFATEAFAFWFFPTNQSGLIGSDSVNGISQSIYLSSNAKSNGLFGAMVKVGFATTVSPSKIGQNQRMAAGYVGLGAVYSLLGGYVHNESSGVNTSFNQSGVGMYIALGMSIDINTLFTFNAFMGFVPPIPGGGNCKADRSFCQNGVSVSGWESQMYMLSVGFGMKA